MFYTYGRPQLLTKIITTRSFNNWKGVKRTTLDEAIKNNTLKLKGYYIPNIYLGNGSLFKFDNEFMSIHGTVKKLIVAAFIDYKVVNLAVAKSLNEPKAEQIRSDIYTIVFSKLPNSGAAVTYRQYFDVKYKEIVNNIRNSVLNTWNGTQPSEEIKKLFTTSYTYKKRNRKSKYDWMSTMSVNEIAQKLVNDGETEVPSKLISAMKHRKISVKSVIDCMTEIFNTMSDSDKKRKTDNKIKHNWFIKLTDKTKDNLCSIIKGANSYEYNNLKTMLIRAYNVPDCIFVNGRLCWGPTVGLYYKDWLEQHTQTNKSV